jgi:hypothetical protein
MSQKEVVVISSVGMMSKIDVSRCKVVKEPLLTNQLVLFFRKNHFLVDSVDDVIGIFKAAGLIDLWISKYVRKKRTIDDQNPKVMTIYDLSGTFEIFFIGSFVSFSSFVVEIIFQKVQRRYFRKLRKYQNELNWCQQNPQVFSREGLHIK